MLCEKNDYSYRKQYVLSSGSYQSCIFIFYMTPFAKNSQDDEYKDKEKSITWGNIDGSL